MKTILNNFTNGLFLSGPDDKIPEGYMRRYKGVAPWSRNSAISRDGSTKLYDLDAHSLYYFASQWYSGVSTSVYRASSEIITSLSGDDLTFTAMAPVAGIADYLFVAGGDTLYKIDSDGNETNWGIEPPAESPAVAIGAAGNLTGTYQYHITYLNSATGHRSNADSGYPYGLLLHCDGADEGTTFTDSSDYAHTVTPHGNVNTEQADPKFGTASAQFDGTGDYLTIPDHPSLNPDPTTGIFTFDCWVKLTDITTITAHTIFAKGSSTSFIRLYILTNVGTATLYAYCKQNGVERFLTPYVTGMSINTWYHVALCQSSGATAVFWDGTLVTGSLNSGAISVPGIFYLGINNETVYPLKGELDEVRFIPSVFAFPTGGFTPATGAYALTTTVLSVVASSDQIDITSIPVPTDDQVDTIEIWRTVADGTAFFKLAEVADGTTSYTDDIADTALQTLELPTDNHVPYPRFDDCFGPWNASMFWITRSQEGERGRLYYSPIGRAESMQGFIEVTSDSDGLQKITSYGGNLFVISKSHVFQIYGDNPYYSREIAGIPGTSKPKTVAVTPFGAMWEANEGIRIFSGGSSAPLIAYPQIAPIFRGRTTEGISAFSGDVAAFARGEYFISDGTTTLALDLENKIWRNLGLAISAFHYDPSNDILAATWNSAIIDLENEGDTQDGSANIVFDIKTPTITFDPPSAIEMIRVDADSNGESPTFYRYINDESGVAAGSLTSTAGRRWTEFDFDARVVERLALRILASLSDNIEIHGFEITHWPLVLQLYLDGTAFQIPGRLAGDRQSVIFEPFSDQEFSIQSVYLIRRFFYDINSNSETLTVTLQYVTESGTFTNLSLGTIDTSTRTIDDVNIETKGKFTKLTIAGDFTSSILIRRLELTCTNLRKEG